MILKFRLKQKNRFSPYTTKKTIFSHDGIFFPAAAYPNGFLKINQDYRPGKIFFNVHPWGKIISGRIFKRSAGKSIPLTSLASHPPPCPPPPPPPPPPQIQQRWPGQRGGVGAPTPPFPSHPPPKGDHHPTGRGGKGHKGRWTLKGKKGEEPRGSRGGGPGPFPQIISRGGPRASKLGRRFGGGMEAAHLPPPFPPIRPGGGGGGGGGAPSPTPDPPPRGGGGGAKTPRFPPFSSRKAWWASGPNFLPPPPLRDGPLGATARRVPLFPLPLLPKTQTPRPAGSGWGRRWGGVAGEFFFWPLGLFSEGLDLPPRKRRG